MRDGVVLRADVYRPAGEGRWPVLLARTCYGKTSWPAWIRPAETALDGYAVVVQDIRGGFASAGEYRPFFSDVEDGYDTVEWCAAQPWSNGRVGMFGSSAVAYTQLLAALARPPHLVAIAPFQTWSSFGRGCVFDPSGAFSMYTQEWVLLQALIDPANRVDSPERLQAVAQAMHDLGPVHRHRPLSEHPVLPRSVAEYYYEWLEHPDHDEYWQRIDVLGRYGELEVPAFHLAGWFDRFSLSTFDNYAGLRDAGRAPQKIVAGPWPHGIPVQTACDDAFYGPRAWVDARALVLRWYDHWLKGEDNGVLDEPPVRVFVQGPDEWRDLDGWPPPAAAEAAFHLRAGGRLTREAPGADEPPDRYVHDPADPVPSTPGRAARPRGPLDQRPIEERDDVLVYTSEPLEADLTAIGPVRARLWAATSAVDTDWTVKLVDVRPDGYARRVCDGYLRARYRESQSSPSLLEPGRVYEYELRLLPTAYVFRAGHRIRVEVASSSFPGCDPNLGTGGPFTEDAAGVRADQTVHHDAARPSHVVLAVVED
jgi:putative CocE/NonD family hydrolase